MPHNLPNSDETSTAFEFVRIGGDPEIGRTAVYYFEDNFYSPHAHRTVADAMPWLFHKSKDALGRKAGAGAVDTPPSGRPGVNVSANIKES